MVYATIFTHEMILLLKQHDIKSTFIFLKRRNLYAINHMPYLSLRHENNGKKYICRRALGKEWLRSFTSFHDGNRLETFYIKVSYQFAFESSGV